MNRIFILTLVLEQLNTVVVAVVMCVCHLKTHLLLTLYLLAFVLSSSFKFKLQYFIFFSTAVRLCNLSLSKDSRSHFFKHLHFSVLTFSMFNSLIFHDYSSPLQDVFISTSFIFLTIFVISSLDIIWSHLPLSLLNIFAHRLINILSEIDRKTYK